MGTGVTIACPHCGQETDGSLPFCQLCGLRLAPEGQGPAIPSWLRPATPAQTPATPGVTPQMLLRLTVVAPTVTHQVQGREFALDGREMRIGRAPSCEINLDGDPLVSRFHAQLRPADGGYVISDLNSSNGTLVNDQEITADTLLREGDELTIGECKLRVEAGFFEINTADVSQPAADVSQPAAEIPDAPPSDSLSAESFPTEQMSPSADVTPDVAPDAFPPFYEGATGPMPAAAIPTPEIPAEPAAPPPPPPPPPPTPEELREQATNLSQQLAAQAREAIQEAERLRNALEDARQRVATAQSLQPAADTVTYRGDLAGLRDLVGQVVGSPQHLELVTRLANVAPQLAEALDTLNATEPYAALLGSLADLRKKLDDALA
jgi:predicted component of type VI protein secretion system